MSKSKQRDRTVRFDLKHLHEKFPDVMKSKPKSIDILALAKKTKNK